LAVAIVAAAYLFRSIVMRDGDFSVDVLDAIALLCFVVVLVAAAYVRRTMRHDDEKPGEEGHREDDRAGEER
jgi:Ca2+/Na+ antiporter